MIFTFRMASDENPDFMREILIDADATFLDLHDAVMDSVAFDKEGMSSFFITTYDWEKAQEITREDMGADPDQDVYLMEETPLTDFIEDPGQRLLFTFDYFGDRSFFMELKKAEAGKHLAAPEVSKSVGKAPEQFSDPLADVGTAVEDTSGALDLDESFFGSSDYNDDELESLEDMSEQF